MATRNDAPHILRSVPVGVPVVDPIWKFAGSSELAARPRKSIEPPAAPKLSSAPPWPSPVTAASACAAEANPPMPPVRPIDAPRL